RGILAVSDRSHQVVWAAETVIRCNTLKIFVFNVFERYAVLARFFVDKLLANLDRTLALMNVQPVLDFVSRARGANDAKPVAARFVPRLRDDLDDVSAVQFVSQRDHSSIHLRANARMPDFGVDRVCKVYRR